LRKNTWLVDLGLAIIILIMGVFVYFRITRLISDMQGEVQEAKTPQGQVSPQRTTKTPEPDDHPDAISAPEFTLTSLEGDPVSLSDHQGLAVMINFWATWCPPCLAELPLIESFAEKHSEDLVVLAINAGEAQTDVINFVNQYRYDLLFLLDPSNSVANDYQIRGLPTSVFIDRDGMIQAKHIGLLNENLLMDYFSQVGVVE